jgi:hypothetical protein
MSFGFVYSESVFMNGDLNSVYNNLDVSDSVDSLDVDLDSMFLADFDDSLGDLVGLLVDDLFVLSNMYSVFVDFDLDDFDLLD